MNHFPYFVNLSSVTHRVRIKAASWALDRFGNANVNPWDFGPNEEPGFWFHRQEDALMFTLKWI